MVMSREESCGMFAVLVEVFSFVRAQPQLCGHRSKIISERDGLATTHMEEKTHTCGQLILVHISLNSFTTIHRITALFK